MSSNAHPSDRGFWLLCGPVALAVFAADQLTKLHAESTYLIAPPWPTMAHHRASSALLVDLHIIELKITHVANAGVVLGLLEETLWPLPVVAFYGASGLAITAAVALLRLARPPKRLAQVAAVALLVGVFGNMVDRLRLGYVVDWFYAESHFAGLSFDIPAFNVADLALVAGAALAAMHLARRHLDNRQTARVPRAASPSRDAQSRQARGT